MSDITTSQRGIVCPHCYHVHPKDEAPKPGRDKRTCTKCGTVFELITRVKVTYHSVTETMERPTL